LITSRLGVTRNTDFTIGADEDAYARFIAEREAAGSAISCLLVDEAQFLSERQVDDLLRIAVIEDTPVLAYGIRTDFQTVAFPGSRRLLEVAHSLEELKTICRCGRKALFNARKVAIASSSTARKLPLTGWMRATSRSAARATSKRATACSTTAGGRATSSLGCLNRMWTLPSSWKRHSLGAAFGGPFFLSGYAPRARPSH